MAAGGSCDEISSPLSRRLLGWPRWAGPNGQDGRTGRTGMTGATDSPADGRRAKSAAPGRGRRRNSSAPDQQSKIRSERQGNRKRADWIRNANCGACVQVPARSDGRVAQGRTCRGVRAGRGAGALGRSPPHAACVWIGARDGGRATSVPEWEGGSKRAWTGAEGVVAAHSEHGAWSMQRTADRGRHGGYGRRARTHGAELRHHPWCPCPCQRPFMGVGVTAVETPRCWAGRAGEHATVNKQQ